MQLLLKSEITKVSGGDTEMGLSFFKGKIDDLEADVMRGCTLASRGGEVEKYSSAYTMLWALFILD
jgi:hypothetical protein